MMRVAIIFASLFFFQQSVNGLKIFQTCGSEITTGTGLIQSPNYPNKYPRNTNCVWTLVAPSGVGWQLDVEDIDNRDVFNDGSSACTDTLNIYELKSDSTKRVIGASLCGSSKGDLTTTTFSVSGKIGQSTKVEIKFKSDYGDEHPGFSIKFKALCDRTIESDSGSFSSPAYPNSYIPDVTCTTIIRSPPGSVLELKFDTFDIEDTALCQKDYLDVEIGSTVFGRSQPKRHCGTEAPNIYKTTSSQVTLTFVSNSDVVNKGFSGTWRAVYFPTPMTNNINYNGRCATTQGGIKCQRWDSRSPHKPLYTPDDNHHNFCRSPDNDVRAPWCYTVDPEIRFDYCDISNCVEEPTTTTIPPPTTTPLPTTTPYITTIDVTTAGPTTEQMVPTTLQATTAVVETVKITTEPSTVVQSSASAQPRVDEWTNEQTTSTLNVTAKFIDTPSIDKQTKDIETAFPWYAIVIALLALMMLVFIIVVLVKRRKKQKLKNNLNIPPVVFTQIPEERPRENTYVEIPFISSSNISSSSRQRGAHAQDDLKKSANGYVDMNERKSSSSSNDSIVAAKLRAYKEDKERRDEGYSSNPYDMAQDNHGDPNNVGNAYEAAGDFKPALPAENPYQSIATPTKEKPPKKKKKLKFFKSKGKTPSSQQLIASGFENPSFRESKPNTDTPQNEPNVATAVNRPANFRPSNLDELKGADSSDNPFSSEDETERPQRKQEKYTEISPRTKRNKGPPLPQKQTSIADKNSETYDCPSPPISTIYQVPSPFSSQKQEEAPTKNETPKRENRPPDLTYDTPNIKPDQLGSSGEMVPMSPDIIDEESTSFGRPRQKSSPTFERAPVEENLYNSPTSSFKNKDVKEDSPESDDIRRRASSRSELDFDNQKDGYCVMTSVPRKKRSSKPDAVVTETPPSANPKRESGMYVCMSSPSAIPHNNET